MDNWRGFSWQSHRRGIHYHNRFQPESDLDNENFTLGAATDVSIGIARRDAKPQRIIAGCHAHIAQQDEHAVRRWRTAQAVATVTAPRRTGRTTDNWIVDRLLADGYFFQVRSLLARCFDITSCNAEIEWLTNRMLALLRDASMAPVLVDMPPAIVVADNLVRHATVRVSLS